MALNSRIHFESLSPSEEDQLTIRTLVNEIENLSPFPSSVVYEATCAEKGYVVNLTIRSNAFQFECNHAADSLLKATELAHEHALKTLETWKTTRGWSYSDSTPTSSAL